jgi:hypothetical protein
MAAGTVAAPLLLERFTSAPPTPAGAASVTVPAEVCPAVTTAGFAATLESWDAPVLAGLITSEAELEVADAAVIRTDVELDTAKVAIWNVPVVWPCGIVMLAGTEAAALLLDRLT